MRRLLIIIGIAFLSMSLQPTGWAGKITKPSERAVYHNNRGVKFLSAGDLELAEIEFKTAAELSPDYVEAYNNLGIVAKKRGDVSGAVSYFEKALELDKNYGAAYSHLSMVYLDMGDINKALSVGKIATKKGATMPITHYNLGMVYLAKNKESPEKDYSKFAEDELKIATELNSNMFEAHLALARLYKEQGNYELSTIRYRLAIENHPLDSTIWTELGQVYQAMGDDAKAENAFRKALSISTDEVDSSNPHMQLGLEYLNRKDYEKAIEELGKAVKIDPKNEVVHYRLGTAYLNLGEIKRTSGQEKEAVKYFKSAIGPLQKALALNPQMADAAYNLGLAYFRLGDISSAEARWNQTLEISPNHGRALYNLGLLYKGQGNIQKANGYLCRFAGVAGQEFAAERENALNIIKVSGGRCQN